MGEGREYQPPRLPTGRVGCVWGEKERGATGLDERVNRDERGEGVRGEVNRGERERERATHHQSSLPVIAPSEIEM